MVSEVITTMISQSVANLGGTGWQPALQPAPSEPKRRRETKPISQWEDFAE
jgi:hypothetical protein